MATTTRGAAPPLPPGVFFSMGRWMRGTQTPGGGHQGVFIPAPEGYNEDGTPKYYVHTDPNNTSRTAKTDKDVGYTWRDGTPGSVDVNDPGVTSWAESNPAEWWQQWNNDMFGQRQSDGTTNLRDTPLNRYAQNQFGKLYADYMRLAQETNQNIKNGNYQGDEVTWANFLEKDMADTLRNSFSMQSPNQKGYELSWLPAGRMS